MGLPSPLIDATASSVTSCVGKGTGGVVAGIGIYGFYTSTASRLLLGEMPARA